MLHASNPISLEFGSPTPGRSVTHTVNKCTAGANEHPMIDYQTNHHEIHVFYILVHEMSRNEQTAIQGHL